MARLTYYILASRCINRLLGGQDEMLCARAHRQGWRAFEFLVDGLFMVIRLRCHRHCAEMELWERVYGRNLPTPKIDWKKGLRRGSRLK